MTARLIVLVLGLVFGSLAPALARPVTEAEQAALAARIEAFNVAMDARDFATIVAVIPPPVIAHIAGEAKIPVGELEAAIATQMEQVFADVALVDFGMDLAAAEHRELADGEPYLLIPTTTVLEAEGIGRMQVESHTLGMLDAGTWYLVRTSDAAMVGILRAVYPQFAGVEFPAETVTAVED
jgi:hypothetical protein